MTRIDQNDANRGRMWVIFDDAMISLPLAAGATLEDIVLRLEEFPAERYGDPRVIDVMPSRPSKPLRREIHS
jgi:hypothetical protein